MFKAFTQEAEAQGFAPPQPKAVPAQICKVSQKHWEGTSSSQCVRTGVAEKHESKGQE